MAVTVAHAGAGAGDEGAVEVLGDEADHGRQQRPDDLGQVLVRACIRLHVRLEEVDGPSDDLVDVGGVVGGEVYEFVERDAGVADGEAGLDHCHGALVEAWLRIGAVQGLEEAVVGEEDDESFRHACPPGDLGPGEGADACLVGQTAQVVGRLVAQVADLGEREAVVGQSANLRQSGDVCAAVLGAPADPSWWVEQAQALVVPDGVDAGPGLGGQVLDAQCPGFRHGLSVRAITLSVNARVIRRDLGSSSTA